MPVLRMPLIAVLVIHGILVIRGGCPLHFHGLGAE